ncbi:hypothetical protein [Thiomonas sp.]
MWHAHAETFHPAYHAYGAAGHHLGWFGHTVLSAIIHGLVYGLIFQLFRGMGIWEVLVCTVVGLGLAGLVTFWFTRRGSRRR